MITITLQKIKNARPCADGWQKLLKSKGGSEADMGAEFPLADVLESNGLDDTLWCLRCLLEHNHNLWRKYAVWCARQVQHLMTDQRSVDALDVAWRHSEGAATDDELDAAKTASRDAAMGAVKSAEVAAWSARVAASASAMASGASAMSSVAAGAAARAAGAAARAAGDAGTAARAAQKAKLLEILNGGKWVDNANRRVK